MEWSESTYVRRLKHLLHTLSALHMGATEIEPIQQSAIDVEAGFASSILRREANHPRDSTPGMYPAVEGLWQF